MTAVADRRTPEPMASPQRTERATALAAARGGRGLANGLSLLSFVAATAIDRMIRRVEFKPHQARKRRISWLGTAAEPPRVRGPLRLPEYRPAASPLRWSQDVVDGWTGAADDAERTFADHRWGHCLVALWAGSNDRAEALRRCVNWIESPPSREHPAWEPYSSAERVANLLTLLAIEPALADGDQVVGPFIAESAAWIRSRIEYYGPAGTNNHILNNARALAMAGAALADEDLAMAGVRLMVEHGRILLAAGVLRERSAHYQVLVANWLFDAEKFVSAVWPARPELGALRTLLEQVKATVPAFCRLCEAGGVLIGDVSPDATPEVSARRVQWLYPEACNSSTLPAETAGWYFIRAARSEAASCVGTMAYPPPFPTHGHCDVAHFVWLWNDTPILGDAGRMDYAKTPVSTWQCGAPAHNVPLIDGCGPVAETFIAGGRWHLMPHSSATIRSSARPGSLTIEHSGFSRVRRGLTHRRTVHLRDDERVALVVDDEFTGSGTVMMELLWHFAPGFEPDVDESGVVGRGLGVTFRTTASESQVRASDIRWSTYPVSSAYGRRVDGWMARSRFETALPVRVATVFSVRTCVE